MKEIKVYVVDNSVVLKPLLREAGSEKVERLFVKKDNFEISILVPDIFRYEFFNKMTKDFSGAAALEAYNAFIEYQVSIIPMGPDLIESANLLIKKHPKITFYDAAYHALAKAYDADFITADQRYYEQTKREGNIKMLDDLKL